MEENELLKNDPKPWTVLRSEYLIRRPWLTARRDCVRLPSGVECDEYWVLEYPTWVNVIALTKDGRMIMERQYRHGLGSTEWEIPAGVVEQGETPEEAGRRELMEETGYGGGRWTELTVLSPNAGACANLSHSFLAEGVERVGEAHQESTEDIAVHLLPVGEVRRILERDGIKQALMAAPLWKFFASEATKSVSSAGRDRRRL